MKNMLAIVLKPALLCGVAVFFMQCDITPAPAPIKDIPENSAESQAEKQDYLFDDDTLRTYELLVDEALFKSGIDLDVNSEEYVVGKLVFEGDTIDPIGVRYKGAKCPSKNNYKDCTKLSMKVKINWSDNDMDTSDVKLRGLKKLLFHSMNFDKSQLHERLGYWLYREMGVPAPRSTHARVIINGNYNGIYAFTEQIDGRFTRSNFDDGKGNLYKEVWPLNQDTTVKLENEYLDTLALKTNEDENPSAYIIKTFAEEVAVAEDADALKTAIEKWMDIESIIAFAAVNRAIKADDGPFLWDQKKAGNVLNRNYFWYEETSENKIHLLPWGLDNAFENLNVDTRDYDTYIPEEWNVDPDNCLAVFMLDEVGKRPAKCDKLTAGWMLYNDEYIVALKTLRDGPMTHLSDKIDNWVEQIQTATVEAADVFGDAISEAEWGNAVQQLKIDVARSIEHINEVIAE